MGWFLELFGRRGKKCARCRKLLKKTEPVTQIEDKRFETFIGTSNDYLWTPLTVSKFSYGVSNSR
jgi:hypothetical protein